MTRWTPCATASSGLTTLCPTPGTPATVILTVDVNDLLNRTGYAVTGDGTLIPTSRALGLASQAKVYWAAITSSGVPLRLGRTRRIASAGQTAALIARDMGCSFPGCDTGPEWCERHHVIAWADGGTTDLRNLTLLCRYHHHNFLSRGWGCAINSDGLPEWRPPSWVDRTHTDDQQPHPQRPGRDRSPTAVGGGAELLSPVEKGGHG